MMDHGCVHVLANTHLTRRATFFFFYVFDPNPEKWQVCSKGLVSVFYKGFFYNHASEASLP